MSSLQAPANPSELLDRDGFTTVTSRILDIWLGRPAWGWRSPTVFAGADVEATERLRGYFITGYPPSSPSIALLRGGKLSYMMERHQIENQEAHDIASQLTAAFDEHCSKTAVAG